MRRTAVLGEAFVTRFEDALDRHKKGRLTAEAAGDLLGISARHFRRMRGRYEACGADGLGDRRIGRISHRRRRRASWSGACGGDFTVKHFHEELRSVITTRWATR